MPIIYVFEPEKQSFSLHELEPEAPMPYVKRFFFPVSDFMAGAFSAVGWTDARALRALDALAAAFAAPFTVVRAFRRYPDLRHNMGLRFSLLADDPPALRARCLESGLFSRVSPPFAGGRALSVAAAVSPSGPVGVHIFSLQDALLQQGLYAGPLSGRLSPALAARLRLTNA
ncbi:MAG: hypothetical protein Q4C13_01560 [Clostridia bacterium]|nr:hypothetical protein [Clostridia bacterium]